MAGSNLILSLLFRNCSMEIEGNVKDRTYWSKWVWLQLLSAFLEVPPGRKVIALFHSRRNNPAFHFFPGSNLCQWVTTCELNTITGFSKWPFPNKTQLCATTELRWILVSIKKPPLFWSKAKVISICPPPLPGFSFEANSRTLSQTLLSPTPT